MSTLLLRTTARLAHSQPTLSARGFYSSLASRAPLAQRFEQIPPPRFRVPLSGRSSPFSAQFRRTFTTDSTPVLVRPTQQQAWLRLALSGLAIGGTVALTSVFLNRETRDSLSSYEREFLHGSFQYTAAGLAVTAVGARMLFKSGFAVKMMSANPWLVLGLGVAGSVGSMLGVFWTPPENTTLRHAFWLAFNASQAASLSPLFFFSPAILSRAALYTLGVVGSLSYVGATAKSDKFLYMGGPLLAGVTVVALSGLAPMALPLGMRGLAIAESLSLYGGLVVFGGFVLYDTQKILHHARMAQAGMIKRDTMKESISLQLDFINIFVRLVQILAMQQRRK